MKLVYFPTQSDLRKWFEKNHKKEKELFVGYYKVSSGKPSVTWSESVDEESYCIRFTPRNPKSNWSAINIKKVEELTKLGLMKPEGLAAFSFRKDEKSETYSYENTAIEFDKSFLKKFKSNKKAWEYFQSSAPSYKKITTRWIMSAKQEITRLKRLKQ